MTPAEVIAKARTIRTLADMLKVTAKTGDAKLCEETILVLEGIIGSIVAAMQTEGFTNA